MNSCIFENPSVIEEAIDLYGSQSVVASIDIKKNFWENLESILAVVEKSKKLIFLLQLSC